MAGWVGGTYRGTNIVYDPSTGRGPDQDSIAPTRPVRVEGEAPLVSLQPGSSTSCSIEWTCCEGFAAAYRVELRLPGDDRPIGFVWADGAGPIIEDSAHKASAVGVRLE